MKKSVLAIVCALATVGAYAQGTINFANVGAGINAPVFDVDGTTRLSGGAFMAQLYGGPNATSMTPQGSPVAFLTGGSAGFFLAPTPVAVTGVAPGTTGSFQVKAWNAAAGATYEAASGNAAGFIGNSDILSIATGGAGVPPGPPASLTGLQSFALVPVPEPTTIALGLLGAAALMLRRRNK